MKSGTPVKMLLYFVVMLLAFHASGATQKECIHRSFSYSSTVCVCNATYCDTIPSPPPLTEGQYVSYTSSKSGLRFKLEEGKFQSIFDTNKDYTVITINSNEQYQSIIGWGGSFTDSTGININSLNHEAQENLLRSYFSEDGLEYSLCRVPIGGTDFSTHGYSYNDGEADPELRNFKLAPEDYKYKIPLVKKARDLKKGNLELFASAWTAPKWMKGNGKYTGPDFLKTEMYQAWANYFLKFLQAYKSEGIDFWGITTGNEPSTGLIPSSINSVGWLPWQMRKWVANNLGPTIRNSEFSSIKLMAIDDQTFSYPWIIDEMFKDTKVKEYIDGFAVHWYWNSLFPVTLLTDTHNKYPDKFILATEACEGSVLFTEHVMLGEWYRAESYAKDIIQDLNNWVTGWIDWNMALDTTGGPTYINNNVDSPIIVNATAGEFYKQPMYYALGHFTKFIPKGSVRVSVTQSPESLNLVALRRPDNSTVVVILNRNAHEVPVKLHDGKKELTKILPSMSIVTILY